MIHIDRRRVPEPELLRTKELQSIRRSAQRYFGVDEADRKQVRFDFSLQFGYIELGEALGKLFHGKCAYCEQPTDYVHRKNFLDRFRPIRGALGLDVVRCRMDRWPERPRPGSPFDAARL